MSLPPPKGPSNFRKPNQINLPSSFPDLFFTALSLFVLFSSSSSSSKSKLPFLCFSFNNRRFRKPLLMSTPNSGSKTHPFANSQSLYDWLKPRLPFESFSSWGVIPGTKNIHNLWLELSEGETVLADSVPPIRTVQVVTVRIIDSKNRFLVESHQELSDGTVRTRWMPLSEKMKPHESVEAAVVRAVKEELGSIVGKENENGHENDIVRIVEGSYRKKTEERASGSYPGLPARYIVHTVEAEVEGLPEGEFSTEEDGEYQNCEEAGIACNAISVKRHFWKWVDADSIGD